jgi:hypothetical protein
MMPHHQQLDPGPWSPTFLSVCTPRPAPHPLCVGIRSRRGRGDYRDCFNQGAGLACGTLPSGRGGGGGVKGLALERAVGMESWGVRRGGVRVARCGVIRDDDAVCEWCVFFFRPAVCFFLRCKVSANQMAW